MNEFSNFQGAVLKEQGVTFAVVRVTQDVLDGTAAYLEEVRSSFAPLFNGIPVILMARDRRGRATFHGRSDIARFLSTIRPGAIQWIDYRVS